jgi:LIVCS family branched-chain amino acid:cation transporter
MLIYPITIVLIILNVLPTKWATKLLFRGVVISTIVFSFPDFLTSLGFAENMVGIKNSIPMGTAGLGWLAPSFLVAIIVISWQHFNNSNEA